MISWNLLWINQLVLDANYITLNIIVRICKCMCVYVYEHMYNVYTGH